MTFKPLGIGVDFYALRHPTSKRSTRSSSRTAENGLIESFNGRLRDECLNVTEFTSLEHARATLSAWQDDYNHRRPHGSLGHLTPNEFAERGREMSPRSS